MKNWFSVEIHPTCGHASVIDKQKDIAKPTYYIIELFWILYILMEGGQLVQLQVKFKTSYLPLLEYIIFIIFLLRGAICEMSK